MQRFVEAEHKWKVGCTSLVVFLCAVQRLRIRLRLRESVVQTSVWVDKDSGWLFQRSSAAWPWYISYQWLRRDGCSQHRCQVFNVSLHLIVFFFTFLRFPTGRRLVFEVSLSGVIIDESYLTVHACMDEGGSVLWNFVPYLTVCVCVHVAWVCCLRLHNTWTCLKADRSH